MLPIGFVIDANEWGETHEHFYGGCFLSAWLFSFLHHVSRSVSSPPTSESEASSRVTNDQYP
jgi:hypothetical protein